VGITKVIELFIVLNQYFVKRNIFGKNSIIYLKKLIENIKGTHDLT